MNFINEALNLTPEQKKRRSALKQKRRVWLAKGKDVSIIDAELAQIEGSGPGITPKPTGMSKDWDEGYQAALKVIKQAQQGNGSSESGSGLSIPQDPNQQQRNGSERISRSDQSSSSSSSSLMIHYIECCSYSINLELSI